MPGKARDISEYQRKRSFERTPEPAPEKPGKPPNGKKKAAREPIFVVQKHDASRLHYDFRLEIDGVLASWAVPKGPSLKLGVRRLAVHVEDHPYSYKDFEGVIPEGNYGAGSVIVWDRGTYHNMLADKPAGAGRKSMAEAISSGKLEIWLKGEKLQGGFALVRIEDSDDQWLLMKMKDEAAHRGGDITAEEPRSVISGRTIREAAHAGEKPAAKKVSVKSDTSADSAKSSSKTGDKAAAKKRPDTGSKAR